MIDFHTHILPNIDDGSQSVSVSTKLLKTLQQQGVDTVCLTPHFKTSTNAVSDFIVKREQSFRILQQALDSTYPKLLLGAEVSYYPGISHMKDLLQLRLQGTKILLLEMPFCLWNQHIVQELLAMAQRPDMTLLLAHIERYAFLQSPKTLEKMLSAGICFQSNAELFYLPFLRSLAGYFLKNGVIHVLGTDTHDQFLRAPHMDAALRSISQQWGESFTNTYLAQQNLFFSKNTLI